MRTHLLIATALSLATLALPAAPALAQDPAATTGTMSAADVGASPLSGVSATDYVKMAADSDMFEIASAKVALTKTKNPELKGFAQQMIADHTTSSKSLMAALSNPDRKIAPPSRTMSSDKMAMVALLKKAPKANFDQLYVQQQLAAHQQAWALQKGYATDGTDQPLKQVAATIVPVVETHLAHIKAMAPPANGAM